MADDATQELESLRAQLAEATARAEEAEARRASWQSQADAFRAERDKLVNAQESSQAEIEAEGAARATVALQQARSDALAQFPFADPAALDGCRFPEEIALAASKSHDANKAELDQARAEGEKAAFAALEAMKPDITRSSVSSFPTSYEPARDGESKLTLGRYEAMDFQTRMRVPTAQLERLAEIEG